jgi:hypothetical protein
LDSAEKTVNQDAQNGDLFAPCGFEPDADHDYGAWINPARVTAT